MIFFRRDYGNSKPKRLRKLRQFAFQINFRICRIISDPAVHIPVCMSQPTTVSPCMDRFKGPTGCDELIFYLLKYLEYRIQFSIYILKW